jgi:AraC-like DNA-binding protein
VPPIAELVVLGELAQAAADRRSDLGLDEIALFFAGRAIEVLSSDRAHVLRARARDRSRAIGATYWIDAHLNEEVSLERLAREAGLSPFYFLRLFVGVLGLTPHQYLLRARLREAARLLADGATPVTEVAGDVGFGDLSNFVRTFGKAARMSPGHFRKLARAKSKILQEPEPATV